MSAEEKKGNSPEKVIKQEQPEQDYVFHKGSIRVSGRSQVNRTGMSAFHEWSKGTRPIEFVFLGSNAGHQAYKACVVACRAVNRSLYRRGLKTRVACLPYWSTVISDPRNGQEGELKDLSVWRLIEVVPDDFKNFKLLNKRIESKIASSKAIVAERDQKS